VDPPTELPGAVVPELGLPPVTEADRRHLVEQVCHGAISYRDVKDREVRPVIESWLSAPSKPWWSDMHPRGRRCPTAGRRRSYIQPTATRASRCASRNSSGDGHARIAMNRVALVVEILAPSMRPVQVTQDLPGFWREHYPRIKSELQRKYPKHEWR